MISKNLKYLRNQQNISQSQLAKLTGISQSAIAKWETNKTEATETNLATLAKFFDVTVDYLLGLEDIIILSPTIYEETTFHGNGKNIDYSHKQQKKE